MASKRRSSISNYPGLSLENSAKLRKVLKALKDPTLPCEVPAACREMLAVGAAEAVRPVVEKRHAAQSAVCTHIHECINNIQVQMKGKIENEKFTAGQDESEIQSLQSQKATADAAVDEVEAAMELRKSEVKEAQAPVDRTTADWETATSTRQGPQLEKQKLEQTAAKYAKFADGPFKLVFDGNCDDAKELKKVSNSVTKEFASMPGLEEALLVAAPGAMAKSASERGAFDNMVMTSLKGKLDDRSAALAVEMADVEAKLAAVDAEISKLAQAKDEAKKVHDLAEVASREAEALHVTKTELRQNLSSAIEARTSASLNRDAVVQEAVLNLELVDEAIVDLESLVARSEVVPVADEPMPAAQDPAPAVQEVPPAVVASPQ